MTGHLDLGVTHNIINVADPSLAQDASTKHYTDAADSLRLKLDGTTAMTGSLNMGTTNKIINVADPTNSTDCATKQYVDSLAVDPNTYLPRDGTMPMTGMLMLGMHKIINVANPSIAQDASTKYYTDTADNLRLKLDGTTAMTGSLDMGTTNKIINLADPTLAQDASTKTYTDTADNLRLKLDGSTVMTGSLNLGSNKIVNITDPSDPQDACTKLYTDVAVKKVVFEANNVGAQTITAFNTVIVSANSKIIDTTFSFLNSTYTANDPGWYMINAYIQFLSTTATVNQVFIYKNNANFRQICGGTGSAGSLVSLSGSIVMFLYQNEFINLRVYTNTLQQIQLQTFGGFRI